MPRPLAMALALALVRRCDSRTPSVLAPDPRMSPGRYPYGALQGTHLYHRRYGVFPLPGCVGRGVTWTLTPGNWRCRARGAGRHAATDIGTGRGGGYGDRRARLGGIGPVR